MLSQPRTIAGLDNATGTLSWSPQCDLRNCGPHAVKRVLEFFASGLNEDETLKPEFAKYLDDRGLDAVQLGAGCYAFAVGFKDAVTNPDRTLQEALEASGFIKQPLRVQGAIAEQFGRFAFGMLVWAMRDSPVIETSDAYDKAFGAILDAGQKCLDAATVLS